VLIVGKVAVIASLVTVTALFAVIQQRLLTNPIFSFSPFISLTERICVCFVCLKT
jgi:hypothetical protein